VDDRAAKWLDGLYGPHQGWSNEMHDALAAEFAAVRREERERCAKVCDELENDRIACADELPKPPHISTRTHDEAEKELHEHAHCFRVAAAAIRAMKEGA